MSLWMCVLAIMMGCGKPPRKHQGVFEEYVVRFETQAAQRAREIDLERLIVVFVRLPADYAGRCDRARQTVQVNPEIWGTAEDASKEILIFHELGHCALYRKHVETLHTDQRPVSVMYPSILDARAYRAYRKEYLDELFQE